MNNDTEKLPKVSILISTKDRRKDLLKLLDALQDIDYPKKKIETVVVEETDEPLQLDDVTYISIPRENRGFGYTRNIAIKNCTHEIMAFIDDDCIPEKNWLHELTQPLKDKQVLGVAGGVRVRDCTVIGYCENVVGFPGGRTEVYS